LNKYDRPIVTTKDGLWCQLAAVLHGKGVDPATFEHACRKYRDWIYEEWEKKKGASAPS
jgi:hypothetical protein